MPAVIFMGWAVGMLPGRDTWSAMAATKREFVAHDVIYWGQGLAASQKHF